MSDKTYSLIKMSIICLTIIGFIFAASWADKNSCRIQVEASHDPR